MKYAPYKVQGTSNPLNIGLLFLVGLIVSILFGWLYNLMKFFPLIYFNVILTASLGIVIGIIGAQILPKLLKVREKKVKLYLVIFMLIVGYYSQWIAHVLYTVTQKIPSIGNYLSYWIFPQNLFEIIGEINKYGTWGIGFSGNNSVNGMTLTLVWVAECAIIFFLGIRYALNFPENPFSEKQNKWFDKLILDREFAAIYSPDVFLEKLNQEGVDIIINAERGLANKYSEISIFYLPKEQYQYLSVETVSISGQDSKKETSQILRPIKITNDEAKQLMGKFGTKKAFFLDF